MSIKKQAQDYLLKILWGSKYHPQGLFEVSQYFRHNSAIGFDYKKEKDGYIASSKNFRHGSIITSGRNIEELEKNVKDAILTSFDIPSSYAKEAEIHKTGREREYALA